MIINICIRTSTAREIAGCRHARERAAGANGAGSGDLRAGAGGLAAEDRVIRGPGPGARVVTV